MEPGIKSCLAAFKNLTGINWELGSHWKHVFLLLWLYFGMQASITWFFNRQGGAAIFYVVWGGFIALISAIGSSAIQVNSAERSLILPATAAAGVFLYSMGTSLRAATWYPPQNKSWREAFNYYSRHAWRYALTGSVMVIVFWYLNNTGIMSAPISTHPQSFGIIVLLILYLLLAIYRFLIGPYYGSFHSTEGGWLEKRLKSGEALAGIRMLYVFAAMLIFLLANAGLPLFF